MTMVATHCPYCALQCGMNLVESKGVQSVAVRPEFPTNRGGLCRKGWTAAELLNRPDRLTTPWMRVTKDAPLCPVGWEEALERIASEIQRIQMLHGFNAVGVFGGGGLTNEKAYSLGKFARVALRTSQIDYNGRFCMSSAASANVMAFGLDRGLPFPLEDIAATETLLLVGSNAAETMPPIVQYLEAQQKNGGNLIVVDPRRTPTAKQATLHLQITPGTDLALANGLLYIAVQERLLDDDFIHQRTTGYDAVRRQIASYWPDRVERITGIPVVQLTRAAHLLGEVSTAMILTARGPEQQSKGTDTVLGFINLALALGKMGKPFCGYGCLTGQGNGQGGRELGQKADQLPGYRSISNRKDRAHIASVWGIDPEDLPGPGRSAYEMFDAIGSDDGIRALLVMGSNPLVSAPRAGHVSAQFEALDFLCVSDIFLSETAERADVVLPTTQWAEEEGTMTNLEGRVLLRRKAVAPPPGVLTDTQFLKRLVERLGYGSYFLDQPEAIFEEIRRATEGAGADYSGISYARIAAEDGVFWPCPHESHPGTPRVFLEAFAHPNGRARFHAVGYRPAAEEPDDEYPLYLTTGRVMQHYQSGTQSRRVKVLEEASPEPFAEIHPLLASRFGIAGASFAVALPLASRWYPPELQGLAMGIAGMGNSGTVLATLFAPLLAKVYGWHAVMGMLILPVTIVLIIFTALAKDAPGARRQTTLNSYLAALKQKDAYLFCLLYFVTFGGFVGLSSFLNGFFVDQFGVVKASVGIATAPLIIAGSLLRPVGGGLADCMGGIRMLTLLYGIVIVTMVGVGFAMQSQRLVFALLFVGMGCLGMGNGAVFQLVPQQFRADIGAMTGLVGAVGGVGGFYLNVVLGNLKDVTGSYASGFWAFALTALAALVALRIAAPGWMRSWLGAGGVAPSLVTQAVVNSPTAGRTNTVPDLID